MCCAWAGLRVCTISARELLPNVCEYREYSSYERGLDIHIVSINVKGLDIHIVNIETPHIAAVSRPLTLLLMIVFPSHSSCEYREYYQYVRVCVQVCVCCAWADLCAREMERFERACMYVRVYIYIYIHSFTYVCVCVCVCIYMYVYMIYIYNIHTYRYTHIQIYIYIYIHIYMYIYIYISTYIYIYILYV